LSRLLETFHEEVEKAKRDPRYLDPEGLMIIEDWQADLKKITLLVVWTDNETGELAESSQTQYLHRFSDYGQGE
jgi:hypothetical protein